MLSVKNIPKTKIAPRGSITETHYHPAIRLCIHCRYEKATRDEVNVERLLTLQWASTRFLSIEEHFYFIFFYYLHIISVLP